MKKISGVCLVVLLTGGLLFFASCENPYFPRKSGEDPWGGTGPAGPGDQNPLTSTPNPDDPNDPINYIAGLKDLKVDHESGRPVDFSGEDFQTTKHNYVGFLSYTNNNPGKIIIQGIPLDEAVALGGKVFYKKYGPDNPEYPDEGKGYAFTLDVLYTTLEVSVRVPADNPQAKQTYYVNIVNTARQWPENIKLRQSAGGVVSWGRGGGGGGGSVIETHSDIFIPSRKVTVKPFELAHFETNALLYQEVYRWATEKGGYKFRRYGNAGSGKALYDPGTGVYATLIGEENEFPVTNITWYDAAVWCNAYTEWYNNFGGKEAPDGSKTRPAEQYEPVYYLNGEVLRDVGLDVGDRVLNGITADWTKSGYRLPTEVEWEYAARGGVDPNTQEGYETWKQVYSGSDDIGQVAWYAGNSDGRPHKTGTKGINEAFGTYDMSGNVVEWCWDWYTDKEDISYDTPVTGPDRAGGKFLKVLRGGGFDTSEAMEYCKVRNREYGPASEHKTDVGFRVARSLHKWES
jgi:formylglycine-generating enzyme required for sulfatase activity